MRVMAIGGTPDKALPCYKCGQPVQPSNSVIWFESVRQKDQGLFHQLPWWDEDCHLLPVEGDTLCIGSPSRFQLFEGYPPDPREDYHFDPEEDKELIKRSRAAYEAIRNLPDLE